MNTPPITRHIVAITFADIPMAVTFDSSADADTELFLVKSCTVGGVEIGTLLSPMMQAYPNAAVEFVELCRGAAGLPSTLNLTMAPGPETVQ